MDVKLLAAVIGVGAGAVGYWFTTFNMQPILRYKNIRNKVLIDFIYYAQVVNAGRLNDEMKTFYRERVKSNRKTSSELTAAILDLPRWYLAILTFKGLKPSEAAAKLIAYSNTPEWELGHSLENFIRRNLGLPEQT